MHIDIYDINGNKIRTLINKFSVAGDYTLTWNGLDEALHSVSGGIYIYKLQVDNFVQTKKMVLLK